MSEKSQREIIALTFREREENLFEQPSPAGTACSGDA